MSEALVPVVTRREIAGPGAAAVALPEVIVDAGPAAVERFLEFFAAAIANDRTRAAYGRAAGRFLGWCRGARLGAAGDCAAPRGGLHPHAPGVGADGEAAPGRDPGALRLAGRPPGAAREPGRGGAGPEACWSRSMAIAFSIPCARRTCLPAFTGNERPGRGAARQPCRAQSTTHAGYPGGTLTLRGVRRP